MSALRSYTNRGVSSHAPSRKNQASLVQRDVLRRVGTRAKVACATDLSIYRVRTAGGFILRGRA
jgi:hypothetical protein